MLRRQRVSERICCCGRKVANLKIFLFSATKQDIVGPSLQSRNTLFYICRLWGYLMTAPQPPSTRPTKCKISYTILFFKVINFTLKDVVYGEKKKIIDTKQHKF